MVHTLAVNRYCDQILVNCVRKISPGISRTVVKCMHALQVVLLNEVNLDNSRLTKKLKKMASYIEVSHM